MFVAQLTDKNGTVYYVTPHGTLSPVPEQAERFHTAEAAKVAASPRANGIPSNRIAEFQIRGAAVTVEEAASQRAAKVNIDALRGIRR